MSRVAGGLGGDIAPRRSRSDPGRAARGRPRAAAWWSCRRRWGRAGPRTRRCRWRDRARRRPTVSPKRLGDAVEPDLSHARASASNRAEGKGPLARRVEQDDLARDRRRGRPARRSRRAGCSRCARAGVRPRCRRSRPGVAPIYSTPNTCAADRAVVGQADMLGPDAQDQSGPVRPGAQLGHDDRLAAQRRPRRRCRRRTRGSSWPGCR